MRLCVLDFETYWSVDHSLTKINPIAYCTHPDTEIISVAAKFDDGPVQCIFGEAKIKNVLSRIDWSDTMVIGHNMSGFDAMLLAWRCGVKPKLWGCTLAMSRPFFQITVGGSLKKVAAALGVGEKGSLEATNTKGKHLEDFTPEEIEAMREYNKLDVELCYGIFNKLAPLTSKKEIQLIDATIRMLVEPEFVVDKELLEQTLDEETRRKRQMLMEISTLIDIPDASEDESELIAQIKTQLASSAKFAGVLKAVGVDVPTKPSPTNPNGLIPALSKTDEAFTALTDHPNEIVAAAARARLDVKSTILESRIGQFLMASQAVDGKMPIPLNYYAATTGRWGGSMSLNLQNLPRVPRDKEGNIIHKPTNALRMCLRAPKGKKVVVVDLSGIELRVNHYLWKAASSMSLFDADPEKADLYKDFASKLYEVAISEVTKPQRQIGKIAHLGLGFGAGAKTFTRIAKTMGGVDMSEDEAVKIVRSWRSAYPEIKNGWRACGDALAQLMNEDYGEPIDPWGICVTRPGGIETPVGVIRYASLEFDTSEKQFWYGEGRNRTRLTGPKVDENLVQHLARGIMAEQLLKVGKQYKVVHCVHDEIVVIVEEEKADECLDFMLRTMRTSPDWWPEIALWAEGGISDSYGSAK